MFHRSYLQYIKARGYEMMFIWACPPLAVSGWGAAFGGGCCGRGWGGIQRARGVGSSWQKCCEVVVCGAGFKCNHLAV